MRSQELGRTMFEALLRLGHGLPDMAICWPLMVTHKEEVKRFLCRDLDEVLRDCFRRQGGIEAEEDSLWIRAITEIDRKMWEDALVLWKEYEFDATLPN